MALRYQGRERLPRRCVIRHWLGEFHRSPCAGAFLLPAHSYKSLYLHRRRLEGLLGLELYENILRQSTCL